ncbi:hypothetical protein ACWEV3_00820 [Saccharopolyspora sp. NPDC003752]
MGNWFTDGARELGGSASDLWAGMTGGETRAEQAQRMRQQLSTAVGQKQRQDLAQQQGLQIQGNDPASISQHDNWNDWDQARLANQLKPSLQVDQINASGRAWVTLGEQIAEIFADLDSRARQAAGDGMQGQAAEAGLNAAKPLQDWGQQFGDSVRGTGLKIQEAGVAAGQTKSQLQPPEDYNGTRTAIASMITPAGGIMDAGAQMREREEANKQARQIVQSVYTPGYTAVDSSTPTFPPPVDPLNPPPPPDQGRDTQGISSNTPTSTGRTNTGIGSTPNIPNVPGPSNMDPRGIGDGYRPPAQSGSQWANPPTPTMPGPGLAPTPPGAQPPGGGFIGAMPPGGGAGGPGLGGRGAGGMGAGGRGAGGLGAGGRAGVGGPGMGAGGRAGVGGLGAGAGAAGAAGGRGAAGGGAGAGAGQRGKGSEDQEHDRPSWLEEQDDIWLDNMPRTAPPVFGE